MYNGDVIHTYIYINMHIYNIHANSGVIYIYIYTQMYVTSTHADGGVIWILYWDQHIYMCDSSMTWLILVCDMMRHMRDIKTSIYTGWRRPIECLKLQVIFRIRATDYRALLRKMTYKDKVSYVSSPPCMVHMHIMHMMRHMNLYRSFPAKEPYN